MSDRYLFEGHPWVLPLALVIIGVLATIGVSLVYRKCSKNPEDSGHLKFLQRKWIVVVWAGMLMLYIIIRDGSELQMAGTIIAVVCCATIIISWMIFESIADGSRANLKLKLGWGDKSVEISGDGK